MAKVAKLVYASFMVRVIVDENATDEEIINRSHIKFKIAVNEELNENIEEIINDTECPYGSFHTDN
jgi:hypothetical protein